MVRLNITLPEDVVKYLKNVRNKSSFIADALREKFAQEKNKKMESLLIEGYQRMAEEDKNVSKDWDSTVNDGIK